METVRATRATGRWTFEDYFAWEAEQPTRHEFIDGEVYAMTGGSLRHSRVIVNVITSLKTALRGRPCTLFNGDAKLSVVATGNSFYPDALVCCDPAAMQERGVITDATVVVEVLSPSTATYNLKGKFAEYRQLPSLRHYLVVDPEALTFQHFAQVDGSWRLIEAEDGIDLSAIGVFVLSSELFDDVGDPLPAIGRPDTMLPRD